MMRVQVDSIVSERSYGLIFSATAVKDSASVEVGRKLRVRARFDRLLGAPAPGEIWDLEGALREGRYGAQMEVGSGNRVLSSGRMIMRYLANNVPGIGEARAERLWKRFGDNLAESLSDEGCLDEISEAIDPQRPYLARRLAVLTSAAWRRAAGEVRLLDWLGRCGIDDLGLVRRLHRAFGDTAAERLASNPYVLVPLVAWSRTDALGQRLLREDGADPALDRRRLVGAADEAVKRMLRRGDTAMDAMSYQSEVCKLLGAPAGFAEDVLATAMAARAVIAGHGILRAPGAASLEDSLNAVLHRLGGAPPPARFARLSPKDWAEVIAEASVSSIEPTPSQAKAVAFILLRSLACLVGGAGTGKTYTCRLICDIWARAGGDLVLCALAGKAALKLSRSTKRLAKTIARTLAELDERDRIGEELVDAAEGPERDRLTARLEQLAKITDRTLVVVDEASMIDVATYHAIARRLVDGSRLLLIGDQNQLPPIGFGSVFPHLVADPATSFPLTDVHRQAASTGIPAVAACVREGVVPEVATFEGLADGVSFIPVEKARLADLVVDVSRTLGPDCLVVTATVAGPAGVENINGRLHRIAAAERETFDGPLGRSFAVDDPVIYGANDYRIGLFNGQFGRVLAFDQDDYWVEVAFDGEDSPKRLSEEQLVDLSLAYAVTCHKVQGSSASRVVVPIYASRLLDRSWLYTAVTRAERQVVMIGNTDVFREAVQSPAAHVRRTTGFEWRRP